MYVLLLYRFVVVWGYACMHACMPAAIDLPQPLYCCSPAAPTPLPPSFTFCAGDRGRRTTATTATTGTLGGGHWR